MSLSTKILGDVHLGRRFHNNVPLHRRGERERALLDQFLASLDPDGADLHICMGDLFDHAEGIPYSLILAAANAYKAAARAHPDTMFVIIQGNHDKGRDLTVTTAFDLFAVLVNRESNITIVRDWCCYDEHLFFGWNPQSTAEECVAKGYFQGCTTAWGHWDVDLRSPSHNLIPTKALADRGVTKIYTGHVHAADTFTRDGVEVVVVGSMTGLAHGEGYPYVTLTLEQLAETDVTDLCVRIRLQDGEVIDEIPNCLQWQVERYVPDEMPDLDVELGEFDMTKVYDEAFENLAIVPEIKTEIDTRWRATFSKPD